MTHPIVETHQLSKQFGDFQALDAVSLAVQPGEVYGLLGPNGAGKSTLIRTLLGFLRPTSGQALIQQRNCWQQRVEVHRLTSYLPGDARLYRMMKAGNVLKLYCQFRETADVQRAQKIAERLELDLNRWVGLMSTGMRQKLALTIALAADVPLLILDEPTANLDPTVRGQVLELVQEARQAGRAVLFSSHVLTEIEDTCDQVGILRQGKLVHQESMLSLKRQHRIRARVTQELPPLPESLQGQLTIKQDREQILIDTPGELSSVLQWLAQASLSDVYVQPVGLRAVYDRFHYPHTIPTTTEVQA